MPERIESLIAKEVFAEFDRINQKVGDAVTNFERLYSVAVKSNQALGSATTFKAVVDGTNKLTEAEKELIKQKEKLMDLDKRAAEISSLNASARKLNAEADRIETKTINDKTKAQEKLNAAKEKQSNKKINPLDDPDYASNVPFTHNLSQVDDEAARIAELEEAQRKLSESTKQLTQDELDAANMAQYEADKQEQLIKALEEKAEIQRKLDNNISLLQGQSAAELLVAERLALGQNTAEQKKLTDAYKNGAITAKEYQQNLAPLIEEENRLKLSVSSLTKELKNQAQIDFSQPGSIDIARARVAQLTTARNGLDITNPEDIGQIRELNAQIDHLNGLIDENSDKLAKQKINIGNYPTAFKGAFNALNGELELVSKNIQSGGFKGKELDELARKQDVLQKATALVSQEFKSTTAQQNAYKEAAKQIGAVYGTNSQVFKAFNKEVGNGSQELKKISKEIDSAAKNTSKFGGAISKAFGGLRQLANIIPGLGISGVILLLLSPLESMAQSIYKTVFASKAAKAAFKELAAEIKTNVTSGLGSAIGDVAKQTAQLSAYVEIAKSDVSTKKQQQEALDAINKIIPDNIGVITKQNIATAEGTQILDLYTKAILARARAEVYATEIGRLETKRFEAYNKLQEDLKNSIEGQNLATIGDKGKLSEEDSKAFEQRRKNITKEYINYGIVITEQQKNLSKKLQSNSTTALILDPGGNADKLKAISKTFFDEELKDQAAFLKAYAAMELGSEKSKSEARREAYRIEKSIIEGQRDVEVENEKEKLKEVLSQKNVSNIAIINARKQYNKRIEDIDIKAAYEQKKLAITLEEDLFKIRQSIKKRVMEENEGQVELAKQYYKEIVDREKQHQELLRKNADADLHYRTNALNEGADILLKAIIDRENKEVEAANGHEEKIKKIREKSAREQLAVQLDLQKFTLMAEIETQKKLLELEKDPKVKQSLLARIVELQKELEKLKGTKIDLNTDKAREKLVKLASDLEKISTKFNEIAGVIGGALDASITAQKNAIQDQMDSIDKKREEEIKAVEQTAVTATNTEEKKAAKITQINAKAQVEKDKLERKQRQLDLERARFEKAQAIANIILNTAQAVSKFLSVGNLPGAIVAGVLGAAQLAVAIATPLPKFAKGTDDAPGGTVIVGDGGVNEYVKTPSGDVFETPATSTVMNIEKHSIIYPNKRKAMEAGIITRDINEIRSLVDHGAYMRDMTDRMTSSIGSKIDQLNSTIKNKTENHWAPRKDGWERIKAHGGNRSRILNDR